MSQLQAYNPCQIPELMSSTSTYQLSNYNQDQLCGISLRQNIFKSTIFAISPIASSNDLSVNFDNQSQFIFSNNHNQQHNFDTINLSPLILCGQQRFEQKSSRDISPQISSNQQLQSTQISFVNQQQQNNTNISPQFQNTQQILQQNAPRMSFQQQVQCDSKVINPEISVFQQKKPLQNQKSTVQLQKKIAKDKKTPLINTKKAFNEYEEIIHQVNDSNQIQPIDLNKDSDTQNEEDSFIAVMKKEKNKDLQMSRQNTQILRQNEYFMNPSNNQNSNDNINSFQLLEQYDNNNNNNYMKFEYRCTNEVNSALSINYLHEYDNKMIVNNNDNYSQIDYNNNNFQCETIFNQDSNRNQFSNNDQLCADQSSQNKIIHNQQSLPQQYFDLQHNYTLQPNSNENYIQVKQENIFQNLNLNIYSIEESSVSYQLVKQEHNEQQQQLQSQINFDNNENNNYPNNNYQISTEMESEDSQNYQFNDFQNCINSEQQNYASNQQFDYNQIKNENSNNNNNNQDVQYNDPTIIQSSHMNNEDHQYQQRKLDQSLELENSHKYRYQDQLMDEFNYELYSLPEFNYENQINLQDDSLGFQNVQEISQQFNQGPQQQLANNLDLIQIDNQYVQAGTVDQQQEEQLSQQINSNNKTLQIGQEIILDNKHSLKKLNPNELNNNQRMHQFKGKQLKNQKQQSQLLKSKKTYQRKQNKCKQNYFENITPSKMEVLNQLISLGPQIIQNSKINNNNKGTPKQQASFIQEIIEISQGNIKLSCIHPETLLSMAINYEHSFSEYQTIEEIDYDMRIQKIRILQHTRSLRFSLQQEKHMGKFAILILYSFISFIEKIPVQFELNLQTQQDNPTFQKLDQLIHEENIQLIRLTILTKTISRNVLLISAKVIPYLLKEYQETCKCLLYYVALLIEAYSQQKNIISFDGCIHIDSYEKILNNLQQLVWSQPIFYKIPQDETIFLNFIHNLTISLLGCLYKLDYDYVTSMII